MIHHFQCDSSDIIPETFPTGSSGNGTWSAPLWLGEMLRVWDLGPSLTAVFSEVADGLASENVLKTSSWNSGFIWFHMVSSHVFFQLSPIDGMFAIHSTPFLNQRWTTVKRMVKIDRFTSWKLTWQWKIHHLKMYLLLNMGVFQCHVSFQGCTYKLCVEPRENASNQGFFVLSFEVDEIRLRFVRPAREAGFGENQVLELWVAKLYIRCRIISFSLSHCICILYYIFSTLCMWVWVYNQIIRECLWDFPIVHQISCHLLFSSAHQAQ